MQFSKFMPLLCAAAVCAGFISARAADNPAQATARAALEEKMREMDAQQTSGNTETPPPVNPPSPAVEQPAAPSTISPPAETQSAPVASSDNATAAPMTNSEAAAPMTNSEAAAPMTNSEAAPPMTNSEAASPVTNSEAAAPPIVVTSSGVMAEQPKNPPPANPNLTASTEASSDTTAQTAARAALQRKMDELDRQQPAETPPSGDLFSGPATKPANVNYPGKELGLRPIESPAPPISAAKKMRLDALLAKYKADMVSPAEYQVQRAAILAEP